MRKTMTAAIAAFAVAPAALLAAPAMASAPTPFPVHIIAAGTLTTTHNVTKDERLVIAGHDQVTVVSATKAGATFVVHVKGTGLSALQGRTVPAVMEG